MAHAVNLPIPVEPRDGEGDVETVWADANFVTPEVQHDWRTEIGVASGLYAFAALGYQLLFGKSYASYTLDNGLLPSDDNQVVLLPPTLYRALLTCLHLDPAHRPESVE